MTLEYTVRPISDRTPFGIGDYKNSQFTVSWSTALELLERELDMLACRHLVIEIDVQERDIRNDGMLRADAKSTSPAVRIAFDSRHGPLQYATDEFIRPSWRREGMREDWQHNVYAIAKSLEALRMVDRYGVSRRGEQYRGWKALPSGSGHAPTGMTTSLAVEVLETETGDIPATGEVRAYTPARLAALLKSAQAHAHPDANNGDRSRWNAVDQAEQVLRRAGRL